MLFYCNLLSLKLAAQGRVGGAQKKAFGVLAGGQL